MSFQLISCSKDEQEQRGFHSGKFIKNIQMSLPAELNPGSWVVSVSVKPEITANSSLALEACEWQAHVFPQSSRDNMNPIEPPAKAVGSHCAPHPHRAAETQPWVDPTMD